MNAFSPENPSYSAVAADYVGAVSPLSGLASVHSNTEQISASLENRDGWYIRELLNRSDAFYEPGSLFRPVQGGRIVHERERGLLAASDGSWEASQVTYYGEETHIGAEQSDVFHFRVGQLCVAGPAAGEPTAFVREIFMGSELSANGALDGISFVVFPLSRNAESAATERVAVTWGSEPNSLAGESAWLTLSFISGNRLHALAREYYNSDGRLISTIHRRGTGLGLGRDAPFRAFYAPLSNGGLTQIASNILRLLRANFPIDIILEHLHLGNTGNMEVDAQHYVLAIHCAFEAWARKLGLTVWIDDEIWHPFADKARRQLLSPIYCTIGPDVKAKLASNFLHANETTSASRQQDFFSSIGLDISDGSAKRALDMRNELLHNGHFLDRWHELSDDERQARFTGIQQLRRICLLVIFRLTGYVGWS